MNPYLPTWEYIPDGEPRVFGRRLYIFGSHDRFGGSFFCPQPYVTWSAPVDDLSSWRYEGVIYRPEQDPLCDGHQLWAPDVIQGPDGRYYLYYCLSYEFPAIGVAVSDAPARPYTFLGYVHDRAGGILGQREGDTIPFDPSVFCDVDGRIYLYSGNGPRVRSECGRRPKGSRVMRLEPDMLTLAEEPRPLLPCLGEEAGTGFEGHAFYEASSVRYLRGRYYLIYSSVTLHELCWAVADAPDGPYTYGGVVVSNADLVPGDANQVPKNCWGNNHGSIVEVNDQLYVFYHRHTNHGHYSRQGMAERVQMTEDGRIVQARMTSGGMMGVLPGRGSFPSSCACHLYGRHGQTIAFPYAMRRRVPWITQEGPDVDADHLPDVLPKQYVTNACHGFVALYRSFALPGPTQLSVETRGVAYGCLEVTYGERGPVLATIALAPSRDWRRHGALLELPACTLDLCLHFVGYGCFDLRDLILEDPADSY